MDFAVAKLGLEARLGSGDVAMYSHPIEKKATAGEFKLASAKFKFKQSLWARVSLPNCRPGPSESGSDLSGKVGN